MISRSFNKLTCSHNNYYRINKCTFYEKKITKKAYIKWKHGLGMQLFVSEFIFYLFNKCIDMIPTL